MFLGTLPLSHIYFATYYSLQQDHLVLLVFSTHRMPEANYSFITIFSTGATFACASGFPSVLLFEQAALDNAIVATINSADLFN